MKKFYKIFFLTIFLTTLQGCQTISKKVDEVTKKEEQELNKWIGKSGFELTTSLGKPERIDFGNSRSRYYVYTSQKLKIKCVRKFEINQNNVVLGFSSKNCF